MAAFMVVLTSFRKMDGFMPTTAPPDAFDAFSMIFAKPTPVSLNPFPFLSTTSWSMYRD